jgi:hypothetical protein
MPCWPEVFDHIRRVLPFWGDAVWSVALVVFLLWAPVIQRRWLRNTSRILGLLAATGLGLAFAALLMIGGLPGQGVPEEKRVIRSADGQMATLIYQARFLGQAGFLGRDRTEVTLKRDGCCRHIVVFWHGGPSSFDDPRVDWLDNRHLRIEYHARGGDSDHCEGALADIAITCIAESWDWDATSPQVRKR